MKSFDRVPNSPNDALKEAIKLYERATLTYAKQSPPIVRLISAFKHSLMKAADTFSLMENNKTELENLLKRVEVYGRLDPIVRHQLELYTGEEGKVQRPL